MYCTRKTSSTQREAELKGSKVSEAQHNRSGTYRERYTMER